MEELNLRARIGRILDVIRSGDAGVDALLLFYACEAESEPEALEHSEIRFVEPEEAEEMDLAPMDAEFLRRARAGGSRF